jgi:hypothetical protein
MIDIYDTNFIDPFEVYTISEQLINFATGAHATAEVEQPMKNSFRKGRETF